MKMILKIEQNDDFAVWNRKKKEKKGCGTRCYQQL